MRHVRRAKDLRTIDLRGRGFGVEESDLRRRSAEHERTIEVRQRLTKMLRDRLARIEGFLVEEDLGAKVSSGDRKVRRRRDTGRSGRGGRARERAAVEIGAVGGADGVCVPRSGRYLLPAKHLLVEPK